LSRSYYTVVTMTDSAEDAARLARGIVEARLGACAQVTGPVRSFYRWQGSIHDEQEWQCLVKTDGDRLDLLFAHIKENHHYDVPDIVAQPIEAGIEEYLAWLTAETRPE
jgi:periplasmic divalent cation tolerance protein